MRICVPFKPAIATVRTVAIEQKTIVICYDDGFLFYGDGPNHRYNQFINERIGETDYIYIHTHNIIYHFSEYDNEYFIRMRYMSDKFKIL